MKTIIEKLFNDVVRKLISSMITLFTGNVIASIFAFLSIVIAARTLGGDIFGIFALITSFVLIVDKLVNFQSWMAIINFGIPFIKSENKKYREKKLFQLISFCVSIDFVTAIIGFLLAWTLSPYLSEYMKWGEDITFITRVASLCLLFKFTSFSLGIYRIYDKSKLQSNVLVSSSIIKCSLFVLCALFDGSLLGFIFGFVISDVILSVLYVISSFKVIKSEYNTINIFKYGMRINCQYLNYVFWTNLSGLIDLPAKELDVMFVGYLTDERTAGVYKILKQIMNMIGRLVSPVYQVVFPKQRELIDNNNNIEAIKFSTKISGMISIIMLMIVLLTYLFSDIVVSYSFGEDYEELNYLILTCILIKSIDVVFTTCHAYYIACGLVKSNTFIILVSNLFMIAIFLIFIPKIGLSAAMIGLAFQSVSTLLFKIFHLYYLDIKSKNNI